MMTTVMLKATEEKIIERLEKLKEEIRLNSERIGEAAAHGDLKENAEYKAAKEEQEILFKLKERMEGYLMNVKLIDEEDISTDTVMFGTKVRLKNNETGEEDEYALLGTAEFELELYPQIMTNTSPLARAIMGKEEGEIVGVELPVRRRRKKFYSYTIQEIQKVQA